MQIDSHMRFEEDWDEYLINYIEKIKSVNISSHQLPIITCYPRAFEVIDFEALAAGVDPEEAKTTSCLLYTSPSPRDRTRSRMPSSA